MIHQWITPKNNLMRRCVTPPVSIVINKQVLAVCINGLNKRIETEKGKRKKQLLLIKKDIVHILYNQ